MMNARETLAKIDLFSELSKSELTAIGKLMTPIDIKAGREFITQGAPGREAFIILDGTAEVRRGGRLVATVGPGEVLGEMAVIAGLHRTASVIAQTPIVAEVLDRREFSALLDQNAKISKKILIAVVKRLHGLEPGLLN